MAKFKGTFLQNNSRRLLLKFVQYLFFESFFVSLNKSVLLHRRCLMSIFTGILILLLIWFCVKVFPIAMVSLFCKNLILPIPHLVLYDRKHFCSILTVWAAFYFCFIKSSFCSVRMWRMFLQTSFQKCSSRSQMFFRSSRPEVFCNKGALRDFAKFTENTCARTSLLLKLQAKVSNFI